MRQQAPLTPGRRRLRTLSSLSKAGRAPTCRQTIRARSGRPAALYHHPRLEGNTISRLGAQASLPACSVGEGVGLYWKYEKWIRKSESRAGSTIGATGAIYAIRRELWRPLPESTILDDVYTPMRIALGGRRVVFEEKARARDKAVESPGREFARKVRTLTGNYQLCQLMPRLLVPTSALVFQFYSHKLMSLRRRSSPSSFWRIM